MGKIVYQGGQTLIGGLNRVYHCNHYNAHLQMSVLMSAGLPGHDPSRLLVEAAAPLVGMLKQQGYSDAELIHEFSFCGFGKLKQISADTWETPVSHYGGSTYVHGKPQPVGYFNAGYVQGLTGLVTTQTTARTVGDPSDLYQVSDEPALLDSYLIYPHELTEAPPRFELDVAPCHSGVDEDSIIAAVRSLPLYGRIGAQQTGLIDAFGVVLTNHFADYYNRISYQTYFAMQQAGIPEEDIKEIFIQSGHVCAFNTFGGIMSSPEWHAVVEPMCQTREDWLHGMIAVINALGWGTYRIEKIDSGQEFVVRIYNAYEGVGYRRLYPPTNDRNISYLAMGALLGLVHLLWKVDIREKPVLNATFYVNQFNHPENSYRVEQTHAIAAGDAYDRIVVYA